VDPMFVQLIEEGVRPVYPKGTVVDGKAMVERADGEAEDDKEGLLIDKYRDCSLAPLFDGIVKRLVDDIQSRD
jgi:hypothetical protein